MARSPYIRSMHPKTEILPDVASLSKVLQAGWVGQLKIHGHRAQLHIHSDPNEPILAYTRQGKAHSKPLPASAQRELRRLFQPKEGWNVLDAEWVKAEDKIYVFDVLKWEGKVLRSETFLKRWGRLPRAFLSPHLVVLPILRDLPSCLKALKSKGPVEGLVFKSTTSTGFSDTSIVRCRRRNS